MRHKIHNTFSIFETKRLYSATRFSQKQGKIKVNNNIKWFNTLKIHAWLGRVEIAVKQKIKKTLQLANKKSGKTIRMNPSLDTNPYNFAILTPFLHVTNFHYAAILTKVSANQRTGNTTRDH